MVVQDEHDGKREVEKVCGPCAVNHLPTRGTSLERARCVNPRWTHSGIDALWMWEGGRRR
jgi:hypothetical protein